MLHGDLEQAEAERERGEKVMSSETKHKTLLLKCSASYREFEGGATWVF